MGGGLRRTPSAAWALLVGIVTVARCAFVSAVRLRLGFGGLASSRLHWAARRMFSGRRGVVAPRVSGAGLVLVGAMMVAWTGASGTGGVGSLPPLRLVLADPGCNPTTPPTAGPNTVCLNESHEGATAGTGDFSSSVCDHGATQSNTQDTFIFVLPDAGSQPNRFFTSVQSVTFDTGPATSFTIDSSDPKFFIATAPVGAILEEAVATSQNGSTKVPNDNIFNLTDICFAPRVTTTTTASGTSSTATATTTTTTTTAASTATVTVPASTVTVTTTTTSAASTATVTVPASTVTVTTTTTSAASTATVTVPASTVATTTTTTARATTVTTTARATTVTTTTTAPGTTQRVTVTTTTTVAGTSGRSTETVTVTREEEKTRTVTHEEEQTRTVTHEEEETATVSAQRTTTQSGTTVTTTVTVSAGVAALSTSSTPPAAVAPKAIPPTTGADVPFLTGFVLLLSGLSLLGWSLRRSARPIS